MKFLQALLLGVALLLGGCAINLSRVQFDEPKQGAPKARFGPIGALQSVCEVERQLALYTDENQHLWLACPYRYEGRTVPLVAYIGPDTQKGGIEFTQNAATAKIKSMKKEALRRCGASQYCSDLSAYGYFDFSVRLEKNQARISYLNLAGGLQETERFYAGLDGSSAAMPLDPQLLRLVQTPRILAAVERLDTLAKYRNVHAQVSALGLAESEPLRSAFQARERVLRVADFRQQGSFEGYRSAHGLTGDRSDLDAMRKLAVGGEQKSAVFAGLTQAFRSSRQPELLQEAEAFASTASETAELAELRQALEQERQAELRRQEEARQADLRRQEQTRLVEQQRQEAVRVAEARRQEAARAAEAQAQEVRAAEERCLRDAACRQAWEDRRAQCLQKVQGCRQGCDRATGSGSYSSFLSNLTAAAMARACYAACTCDNGFGDLLTRFNMAVAGNAGAPAAARQQVDTNQPRAATDTAAAARAAPPRPEAKPKVFECKIYCKSASGPTIIRRFEAPTRKAAAQQAGDGANEFCAQDGKGYASAAVLPESQCRER